VCSCATVATAGAVVATAVATVATAVVSGTTAVATVARGGTCSASALNQLYSLGAAPARPQL
jgi:hypothetical protein